MQKDLSIILRNRLKSLPFVDILAGLAQTLTTQDIVSDGTSFTPERRPVSYDVIQVTDGVSKTFNDCTGKEISLTPNSSRKSIIYFEDGSISATDRKGLLQGYSVPLRLVCWMNRLNLVGDAYKNIAGYCMASVIESITERKHRNVGIFTDLTVEFESSPSQNANIFSKYTYRETDRQYLRPPYEFFAIDFRCTFYVDPKCLTAIDFTQKVCN